MYNITGNKGRLMSSFTNVFLVLLFLFMIINGCHNENKDWQETQTLETIKGYEIFLENYPNSEFSQNAIEEIWRLTKEKNDIDSYESFVNNHPVTPFASLAKDSIKSIWTSLIPGKPQFEIKSNMTVDLEWPQVPGAQQYVVYWSSRRYFSIGNSNSDTTRWTSFNHKNRSGKYGAKLPMFYRIIALKDSLASRPSDVCFAKLLSDNGGTRCQLCGNKSIGYCHLRDIYVCSEHKIFTDDAGTNWRCP